MTEPVAYMWKTERGTIIGLAPNDNSHSGGRLGIPLYTAEKLHQRVKMTQVEFDEFKLLYNLFNGSTVRGIINTIENNESKKFTNLKSRLNKTGKDLEIIVLWSIYNPDKPEETIEIVPDMKWFVRSKEPEDDDEYYLFLSGFDLDNLNYLTFDYAEAFDTKEEAEKWKNPLTEVILLPVEGND